MGEGGGVERRLFSDGKKTKPGNEFGTTLMLKRKTLRRFGSSYAKNCRQKRSLSKIITVECKREKARLIKQ